MGVTIAILLVPVGGIAGLAFGVWQSMRHRQMWEAVQDFLDEVEKAGYPPCWPGPCTATTCRTPDWCNRLAVLYRLAGRARPRVGSDGRAVAEREGRMV